MIEKDQSLNIHEKNIKHVPIKTYKTKMGLSYKN